MSLDAAQSDGPKLLLVEPKLMLPRVQPGVVRRPSLLAMLDDDDDDDGAAPR